jgi:hypothetical protein
MGLRFDSNANETRYMSALLDAANANPEKFEVFTHETMPQRYHFSHNERIAPIYVIPKIGYSLTDRKGGGGFMPTGVCIRHLYLEVLVADPEHPGIESWL